MKTNNKRNKLPFDINRQTLRMALTVQIAAEKAYRESGLEEYVKTIRKMYGIEDNKKTKS